MRSHIKNTRRRVWFPNGQGGLPWLDPFVIISVLFISIVSPVEVTMRREVKANTLFWVAIGCNVVMICEFCVRFNTAYREPRAKGGRWVTNRRSIFMHYLKTWLLIDLISIIPFDLPFAMGVASEEEFTQTIKVLSLLRLLRILKVRAENKLA